MSFPRWIVAVVVASLLLVTGGERPRIERTDDRDASISGAVTTHVTQATRRLAPDQRARLAPYSIVDAAHASTVIRSVASIAIDEAPFALKSPSLVTASARGPPNV